MSVGAAFGRGDELYPRAGSTWLTEDGLDIVVPSENHGGPWGAAITDSHATLRFTREIDAPPALVWVAYADVERRCRWSLPDGEDRVYDRADFTVGGVDTYRCGPPGRLDVVGTNR